MSACDAKIRPFRGRNETEVQCEVEKVHSVHSGIVRDYAWPGSETTISWEEGDRRNFRGEFTECSHLGCTLPAEHWGGHA